MQVQAGIMAKTQETFVIQVFQSDAKPASFAKVQVGMRKARARGGTSAPGIAGAAAGWASAIGDGGFREWGCGGGEGLVADRQSGEEGQGGGEGLVADRQSGERGARGIRSESRELRRGDLAEGCRIRVMRIKQEKIFTGLSLRNCPAVRVLQKKQEEQDSCYENQAVKKSYGTLVFVTALQSRVSSGSTLTVLMTTSQILAGAPLV